MSDDGEDDDKKEAIKIEKLLASHWRERKKSKDVILSRVSKPKGSNFRTFRAKVCSICRRSIAANDEYILVKSSALVCHDCKDECEN